VQVHLVDGTYELFRHHFGRPSRRVGGAEVAATLGVAESLLGMLAAGATHVGVATDHVIESFRNELWPGYKTSAGVPPELLAQFGLLEEVLAALGFCVWPMVTLEADDALAAAARIAAADPRVERVFVCSPDKDLAQCVRDGRVVQLDRRRGRVADEAAVVARFGVGPASIPDWLALVGDSADGYPGIRGFGPRTASALLGRFGHLESVPLDGRNWDAGIRGAEALAATLRREWDRALLFRDLATLRDDEELFDDVGTLRWHGPRDDATAVLGRIGGGRFVERARALASSGPSRDP